MILIPVIPVENILEITKHEIKLTLPKDQLKHKLEDSIIAPSDTTYTSLRRKTVLDYNGSRIGKICNLIFLPCSEVAFVLSCPRSKDRNVPKGFGTKWDLLLPTNTIEKMAFEEITISVKGTSLEKTLNKHLLDNNAAQAYLNSLQTKNSVEMRALMRTVPGYNIRF